MVWWLAVPVMVLGLLWFTGARGRAPDPAPEDVVEPLDEAQREAVATAVRQAVREPAAPTGDPGDDARLPSRLGAPSRGVYVALRHDGRRVAHAWGEGARTVDALRAAGDRVRIRAGGAARRADLVEVCLTRGWRRYDYGDPDERAALLDFDHRGVRGLSVRPRAGGRADGVPAGRWSPTYAVATNRSHARLIELFERDHGISLAAAPADWIVETFECDALLVGLDERMREALGPGGAVVITRGNEVVGPAAVNRSAVEELARRSAGWLERGVHPDGRMTYMFYPSGPSEPDPTRKNNAIRQWMATIALGRYARAHDDARLQDLVARNIDHNLAQQFVRRELPDDEDGARQVGYVRMFGKGKLGAAALAALAIAEHPERERWAEYERLLAATIDALRQPDGSFRTFIEPAGRSDQQNFYPGEALLYLAHRYVEAPTPEGLEVFMRSFRYYRRWHLEPRNRRPAFVPWHTQAYALVWRKTRDPELAAFIFEMNDWLLGMQPPPAAHRHPDTWGRFYDPERPELGSPHASSTGVYLEGLIAAWSVADVMGDRERKARYGAAIRAGLRSAMQLQFVDEVDLYYVPRRARSRVIGGLRTRVFDNRIRCDNVQHNLMAQLEILERFGPEDWR